MIPLTNPKPNLSRGSRPLAFSLIELLVVITIIGVLTGLLLPSLSKAKARATRVTCLGNLRQIGIAFNLYLQDHADRFPDRRDLKSSLGFRPWSTWPPSDPRGGWAAVSLANQLSVAATWDCPGTSRSPLNNAPQVSQSADPASNAVVVTYWLWRFDRTNDPVALDNFWNKTPTQALLDLSAANNPQVGQPHGLSQVELCVDPYFPSAAPNAPPDLAGFSAHGGGKNRLFLDYHAEFSRDARLK